MSYLKTKKQFDALNSFEKRDVKEIMESLHHTMIWVAIELRKPPKGVAMSKVYCSVPSTSSMMSVYVNTNSSIAKNSIEITKIKSWLV